MESCSTDKSYNIKSLYLALERDFMESGFLKRAFSTYRPPQALRQVSLPPWEGVGPL